MDKLNLVEKLREKTGITYEEAKCVLEINNWDILDSILYLEEQGKVKRPSVSIFYTNEYNEKINNLIFRKLKKITIINRIITLKEFLKLYVRL